MDKVAVFLQVRMSSSRLPGKALLPLAGKPAIVHAMQALRSLPVAQWWLITDRESESALSPWARQCGYQVFCGDPRDVLKRFCDAIECSGATEIVRATGDNPLVSSTVAEAALQLYKNAGADYAGITGTPLGTGVEILRAAALQDLQTNTSDPYDHEHVSPGLYRNPDRYRSIFHPVDPELYLPDYRVTLDTRDDYRRLQHIFSRLYNQQPIDVYSLVDFARQELKNSA